MSSLSPPPNNLFSKLDKIYHDVDSSQNKFDKSEHDSKSRLEITKLFLWWYFVLICFAFLFGAGYNFIAAYLNQGIAKDYAISYLDISNTVSLITTTLGSGVGFVIGYYFKNKSE
jgi:ABC-type Fe3+ transport system permease subunit